MSTTHGSFTFEEVNYVEHVSSYARSLDPGFSTKPEVAEELDKLKSDNSDVVSEGIIILLEMTKRERMKRNAASPDDWQA